MLTLAKNLRPCNYLEGPTVVFLSAQTLSRFPWDKYPLIARGILLQAQALGINVLHKPELAFDFVVLPQSDLYPTQHAKDKRTWLQSDRLQALYNFLGIKQVQRETISEFYGCSKVGVG